MNITGVLDFCMVCPSWIMLQHPKIKQSGAESCVSVIIVNRSLKQSAMPCYGFNVNVSIVWVKMLPCNSYHLEQNNVFILLMRKVC